MKSAFRVLPLLPFLAGARAAAAPSFKQAPGGGDKSGGGGGDGGGFDFSLNLGLAEHEWLHGPMQFLADYYGYLGVVFVLLVLFLFARGAGDDEPEDGAVAADGDDDFFEPSDAERFRKPR